MTANRKRIGAAIGVAAGIACAFAPIEGLSFQAACTLGILVWAIAWWVFGVLPEVVTALIMAVLFMTVAAVPLPTVFAAFSDSIWWILLGAFGLGLGMKKSGLVDRIALAVLRKFPARFGGQALALMAAGTVVGPLIPSMTAKLAVIEPLALGISDSLGYERKSRGANGLFLAALVGVRNIGPAVISASIIGYAIVALLPDGVRQQFDMATWFVASLPWFIAVSLLNFAAIMLLYNPERKRKGKGERAGSDAAEAAEAADPAGAGGTKAGAEGAGMPDAAPLARQDRGPMSANEKKMLAIILGTVALWVLEPLTGIPAAVVATGGMALCLAFGIFDLKAFRSGMSWESLFFIGIAMGLATVFAYTGIDEWVVGMVGPLVTQLAFSPYAFVLGIALITVLLRFVIVSEMAFVNIFMAFMVPLAVSLGINPWIVGFTIYALVNPWFVLYQNPVYLAAFYSVEGMVRHADMAKYCLLYVAICMVGLVLSVPYWQLAGFYAL